MDGRQTNSHDADPGYIVRELQRIAAETARAVRIAESADKSALEAKNEISTHERECAIRYKGIVDRLDVALPALFTMVGKTNTVVYTGVGIMLAVPALIGAVLALKQLFAGG